MRVWHWRVALRLLMVRGFAVAKVDLCIRRIWVYAGAELPLVPGGGWI